MAKLLESARPLERGLALHDGSVDCPVKGRIAVERCDGCPHLCRCDAASSSLICSYPLLAGDTYAQRSRRRDDVRIALSLHLERT